MGFFSWKTADTNESIMNIHSGESKPVYLIQPNGEPVVCEPSYNGYGVFGGVDAYEWLAQKNGKGKCREKGIDLAFNTPHEIKVPLKFSFNANADYDTMPASKNCPQQGFFESN